MRLKAIERNRSINFKEHGIKLCLEESTADFCSSRKTLIRLGFNLCNGYTDDYTDPLCSFYHLDDENMQLAMGTVTDYLYVVAERFHRHQLLIGDDEISFSNHIKQPSPNG